MSLKNLMILGLSTTAFLACGKAAFKSKVDSKKKDASAEAAGTTLPFPGDSIPAGGDPSHSSDPSQITPVRSLPGTTLPAAPAYNFSLVVNMGAAVIPAQNAGAIPGIQDGLNSPLTEKQLAKWLVKIHPEDIVGIAPAPVEPSFVDLSANSGITKVIADFNNPTEKLTGVASQIVYVDGEAPKVKIIRLSDSIDGATTQMVWSATDNYKLDEAKTLIIGCTDFVTTLLPRSRAELDVLPANCISIFSGVDLLAKPAQIEEKARKIAGVSYLPRDIKYAIFAQDLVGLTGFAWITQNEEGLLALTATPSAITYTKNKANIINLKLLHVKGALAEQVELPANAKIWPSFETKFTANPAANAPAAANFAPTVPVNLGPADGLFAFGVQVSERATTVVSNQQIVKYILDTTPPKVEGIQLTVDKTVPSPASTISVTWKATDANPIISQSIEVKGASDAAWTKVADIGAAVRSFSFPWGARKVENFQVRINSTDIVGNVGIGVGSWVKQIFNAAVLTTSVQCYFCHIKIYGDVGGIDFPAAAAIRNDSGQNFAIVGKLFGTNAVPPKLGSLASKGSVSNYANTDYKIFPKNNIFPVLTAADLKPRMNGSLSKGAVMLPSVYTGNLTIDGSVDPFLIKGEVFIDGDLIIKGKYKGVGSIYANNIYIVGDVTAVSSPFPFDENPDVAVTQAQASVVRGDDGLYLGALNQIVVGVTNNRLWDEVDNTKLLVQSSPYPSWISEVNFNALGTQAVAVKNKTGAVVVLPQIVTSGNPLTDARHRMEVNRVDAFLYSQNVVSWRAYANILLNGGFMSPKGGFISSTPYIIWNNSYDPSNLAVNPRNDIPYTTSVIRYDYRLRIGGGGFETLKGFFDQQ